MERLTERLHDELNGVWVKNHDYISAAHKLAEYEDLEEQGRLLKLPCSVGDTVYVLRIDNSVYMMSNKKVWEIVEEKFEIRHFDCIGKTVFLTRQEAENKLKEMEGKNGN